MKRSMRNCLLFILVIFFVSCKDPQKETSQPSHEDIHFRQDYSIKYHLEDSVKLRRVYSDRNGVVQVSTSKNLYKPHGGELLYAGSLVADRYYRPVADKNIANLVLYKDHFVYIDDKAVLSNAWAGNLYIKHSLPR